MKIYLHNGRLIIEDGGKVFMPAPMTCEEVAVTDMPAPMSSDQAKAHLFPHIKPKAAKTKMAPGKVSKHTARPKTQDEIDAFLATYAELGTEGTAKQYGISTASVYVWKHKFKKSPTVPRTLKDERTGPQVAESGGVKVNMFKCPVECGQKNWQSRQEFGSARCPRCLAKAVVA